MTALKNLRLYQQELAGIAYEQRSPRLANLADAISHELCALAQLAHVTEAARLLIVEGLRLTPDGLIVREKHDRSDPHYRLCVALEDAGMIPSSRRSPPPPQSGEGVGGET